MQKTIDINMAEMAVGKEGTVIKTEGIGSCIVVTLYDAVAKIGGMAHCMLPSRNLAATDVVSQARSNIVVQEMNSKYADEAIDRLLQEIEKNGGKKENLHAKLIGGASMFRVLSGDKFGIGYHNIETAKKRLAERNILLESEDTGGTVGRIAELDVNTGLVSVITKM